MVLPTCIKPKEKLRSCVRVVVLWWFVAGSRRNQRNFFSCRNAHLIQKKNKKARDPVSWWCGTLFSKSCRSFFVLLQKTDASDAMSSLSLPLAHALALTCSFYPVCFSLAVYFRLVVSFQAQRHWDYCSLFTLIAGCF